MTGLRSTKQSLLDLHFTRLRSSLRDLSCIPHPSGPRWEGRVQTRDSIEDPQSAGSLDRECPAVTVKPGNADGTTVSHVFARTAEEFKRNSG